jgi:hypothetical protein
MTLVVMSDRVMASPKTTTVEPVVKVIRVAVSTLAELRW